MSIPACIEKISEVVWELPTRYKAGMQAPARLFATRRLLEEMDDGVFDQISNVACLPGIEGYVCSMPDSHWGYGFPIGGVAAMRLEDGVVSPGGIGFDINCGMRLLRTDLTAEDIQRHVHPLVEALFQRVPAGVGCKGFLRIDREAFREILSRGARWCVEHGYGWPEDLERTEDGGCAAEADPDAVSRRAVERGIDQLGTLGSGNHFLEIQTLRKEDIFDETAAKAFGLFPNQVVIMFHCGSRGFGHQVASDHLERFLAVMGPQYHLKTPDRELACAPISSPEARSYLTAMQLRDQHVLRQPADDPAPHPRGLHEVLGKTPRRTGNAPGLRCGAQHRQVRGDGGQRGAQTAAGAPQRRDALLRARFSRAACGLSAPSANR